MILLIRSIIFNFCFFSLTIIFMILWIPFLLFTKKNLIDTVLLYYSRLILWILKTIVGIKINIKGIKNIPKEPVIIASKHQSTLEIIIFMTILKNPVIVIKRELFSIPILGFYLKYSKMIPISRTLNGLKEELKKVIEYAKNSINEGRSILIFPEGTRHVPNNPTKYKSGIAKIYENLKISVVPVSLNSGFFWPRRSFIKYPGTVYVIFQRPINPNIERKIFMSILEKRIEKGYQKLLSSVR